MFPSVVAHWDKKIRSSHTLQVITLSHLWHRAWMLWTSKHFDLRAIHTYWASYAWKPARLMPLASGHSYGNAVDFQISFYLISYYTLILVSFLWPMQHSHTLQDIERRAAEGLPFFFIIFFYFAHLLYKAHGISFERTSIINDFTIVWWRPGAWFRF